MLDRHLATAFEIIALISTIGTLHRTECMHNFVFVTHMFIILTYMQNRVPNLQRYKPVVGLVGLGLPLTVTIRVSRVSAMVSARFSVH